MQRAKSNGTLEKSGNVDDALTAVTRMTLHRGNRRGACSPSLRTASMVVSGKSWELRQRKCGIGGDAAVSVTWPQSCPVVESL